MKRLSFGLGLLLISNIASAHTGMVASSFKHVFLHVLAAAGVTFAVIIAGYLFKHLPKNKAQRVRIKK